MAWSGFFEFRLLHGLPGSLCSLVHINRRFGRTCYPHLTGTVVSREGKSVIKIGKREQGLKLWGKKWECFPRFVLNPIPCSPFSEHLTVFSCAA
jgi:hypothetical protein